MPLRNFGFVPFASAARPRASLPQDTIDRMIEAWLAAGNQVTRCPPAPAKPEMWDILENLRRRMPPEPREQPRANAPLFNSEREADLRRLWPMGVSAEEITTALNRLPGPRLTVASVRSRVGTLKLRRPPSDWMAYGKRRQARIVPGDAAEAA
jgi:hypothetical protein